MGNVNSRDSHGETQLHHATRSGDVNAISNLLSKGANIEATNNIGCTPLYAASYRGNEACLRALLRAGAEIDAKTKGYTPLYAACDRGHLGCVRALLEAGAEIDAKTKNGCTPLYTACQEGHLGCVQALLEAGAEIDAKTKDGCTPLYSACGNGHIVCVQALLGAGAEIDARRKEGWTPLQRACYMGRSDCVRALLEAGAEIEAKNKFGMTALMYARKQKKAEVVRILEAAKKGIRRWFYELIALVGSEDLDRATAGRKFQGQVMYVWNRPTTDGDLESFLAHRKSTGNDHQLIVIGGAHGWNRALEVEPEKGPAPQLSRDDWASGFNPGEFREEDIMRTASLQSPVHYVDVRRIDYQRVFDRLWDQYPNADLLICVCFGLATKFAKAMRDRGLNNALAMSDPNTYVKTKVNWNSDIKYRTHRYYQNLLAPRI